MQIGILGAGHIGGTVVKLIDEIGFSAIDTGSVREGGQRQEPGSPIYGRLLTAPHALEILRRRP